MERWQLYHPDVPEFLWQAAQASCMTRLWNVGMNCALEYTSFPIFKDCRPYSRFEHSLGVGLIVWHFTGDRKQALAGLLHDVATPCFSHVVDFLKGDALHQEATEAGTREIIDSSRELQALLNSVGLYTEDVADYHLYPIADNDAPRLSADRLEYTLGNLWGFHLMDRSSIRVLYEDLIVGENEEGAPELMFKNRQAALAFAEGALTCSKIYVSEADRYTMQRLSEWLKEALEEDVISEDDLMGVEPKLITKLIRVPSYAARWQALQSWNVMQARTNAPDPIENWRMIPAKKRCIDPYLSGYGRLSELEPDFREKLEAFRVRPQTEWLRATGPHG